MLSAPLPENEPRRLDALRSFEILDTLPEQGYDDIVTVAAQICQTPIAVMSLIDAERQWFKARLGLAASETAREVAFCAHAILEPEKLFVVPDATADPRFAGNPLVIAEPGIRFYAGAPLVTGEGEALGALCVIDRVPRRLDPAQERALAALGRQVMVQLELRRAALRLEQAAEEGRRQAEAINEYRLRLEEALVEASERSITDTLTGARNRLAFTDRLEAELARHKRYGAGLSLLMIDVDRFKEFNDRFGHPAGDEVLCRVVAVLLAGVRSVDLVARYGGEEFAVILADTPAEGARHAAERLRAAVAAAEWPSAQITVSVGVASAGEGSVDAAVLLAEADAALYAAKAAGRNCVRAAGH